MVFYGPYDGEIQLIAGDAGWLRTREKAAKERNQARRHLTAGQEPVRLDWSGMCKLDVTSNVRALMSQWPCIPHRETNC